MIYEAKNWYWRIGEDEQNVWSSASAGLVSTQDETYLAWLAAGGGPTPISSLEELAAVLAVQYPGGMLLTYAAAKRYDKEVGGILVGGVPIATDDRSKQMITGARIAADADPEFSTPWVGSDGQVYPLTSQQIVGISNAMLMHVAACFATFATVSDGIAGQSITTREQIDAAFAV